MSDLKLTSLHIQNFRGFRDLKIDQLGRVNLIVGKNNVGKTSLLEAIEFYARRGNADVLLRSLRSRDEDVAVFENRPRTSNSFKDLDEEQYLALVAGIFNGSRASENIEINGDHLALTARFQYLTQDEWRNLFRNITSEDVEPLPDLDNRDLFAGAVPCLLVQSPERPESVVSLYNHYLSDRNRAVFSGGVSPPAVETIYTCSMDPRDLLEKWDSISLKPEEELVYKSIRLILPKIERMTFKSTRMGDSAPYVRLAGQDEPLPLRRMGEGTERLFSIGLHLANAGGGFVCIDEVETGLHYTTLPDVWRLIFETAKSLDIQVFATTHSLDAVRAFERVANEHEEEGVLIQLRRRRTDGEIVAVTAEEKELQEALELNVDPR